MIMYISLILVILSLATTTAESPPELYFPGFGGGGAHMTLTGAATIQRSGVLRLTNDTLRVVGHAFYSRPLRLKNPRTGKARSFSAAFAFAIVPEYPKLGGHGLSFALSPSVSLPGALPSQYLGLFNSDNVGKSSNNIVAVELDTVQDFAFGDINDNHVGIDINGLQSMASAPAAYFDTEAGEWRNLSLKSGRVIQSWIDYDSVEARLTVKLSPGSTQPNSSVLSFDVDLSPYLSDSTFVGFSSSTGLLASAHYVLGWSFKVDGKAKSLNLNTLASLPKPKETHTTLALVASFSSILALMIVSAGLFYLVRRIKNADVVESWELDIGPHRFSYDELKTATRGFREKQLIGFGGFGKVYKGTLRDSNTEVAVKRISHESRQGLREFVSEISSIGRLRHRNLVQLLGWCRRRGDLLLVYDFMENGSLDKYLFEDPIRVLSWGERFKIMKGVAYGLLYLHEEWEQTVIHRDVKAGNVLLDSEMNGRLGDFGLAKLYERGSNPSTTRVVGTLGYLAPELTRTGKPTTGSDVYAFGGLLLEVVSGRRPVEPKMMPEELILVDWVWDKWRVGAVLDVVDPKLSSVFNEAEVMMAVKLGLMCSNNGPEARPSMRQVVKYLDYEVTLPDDVASPNGYSGKKGGDGEGFEDFVHSYPSSSIFERASTISSTFDDGGDDVEMGSRSPLTILR